MKIKVSEIVSKVFALLDENETILEERVEYGDPGTMVRPLIEDLLPDVARVTISNAPLRQIDDCRHLRPGVTAGPGEAAYRLPDDFLRLVYVKMSDWSSGVVSPLSYDGEEYRLRLNRKSAARRRRAAVAISYRGDERYLEVFGSDTSATLTALDYVQVPSVQGQYIDLPPALVSDVCARTAEMVSAVIGG